MNGTDMIRDYARVGVRLKLEEMQFALEELYREFPEEFTQKPQVLAATTVNGHRPLVGQTIVKRRLSRPAVRQVVKSVAQLPEKPWGAVAWQRIHDYLALRPKMTATAAEIRKDVKVSDPMVYSIVEKRPDLFVRAAPGVFTLKQKAHKV